MKTKVAPTRIDSRWLGLCRLGGVSALVIAVLLLGEIVVYGLHLREDTIIDCFRLFRDGWLAGLLTFDLLGMISYLFFIPMMLGLFMVLRKTAEATMLVAAALFFVGIAAFYATNTAFPMLILARQYAAAATDAERAMNLAAGQSLLTMFNENAFHVTYVIVSGSWAVFSAVMLKSGAFGRATSWAGLLAGGAGILAVICELALPAGVVFIAISLYFAAIVFLLVWVILTGRRLLQFGAGAPA